MENCTNLVGCLVLCRIFQLRKVSIDLLCVEWDWECGTLNFTHCSVKKLLIFNHVYSIHLDIVSKL